MDQAQLTWLTEARNLPTTNRATAHSLLITRDNDSYSVTVPQPRVSENERVCFIPHILWGHGFPIHPSHTGLLHLYSLQLHLLAPNSILHIMCFVTMCEAFLGSAPHFGLWRKYLCVKLLTNGPKACECGGRDYHSIHADPSIQAKLMQAEEQLGRGIQGGGKI